ncbi:hypothetical protein [Undibacterium fentianense]|uniref:Uncharacterized protein n=1 Tax=Undibacterium fentianense TaxID=2828728 RepID=A0A941E8A2_9BURK|nr:hypothetical protein [Undibacterium fentianense]MBR7801583.1 hypothetical protein [Undibacterium fentianense]
MQTNSASAELRKKEREAYRFVRLNASKWIIETQISLLNLVTSRACCRLFGVEFPFRTRISAFRRKLVEPVGFFRLNDQLGIAELVRQIP